MKKILILIFLFPIAVLCQTKGFDEKVETEIFLQQFFKLDSSTVYIKPSALDSEDYLCEVSKINLLETQEVKQINKRFKKSLNFIWQNNQFKNLKIISDSYYKKSDKDKLVEKLKQNVFVISKPIFIKEGNYCIFFCQTVCGNICGNGDLSLYAKEKGIWIRKETYCDWIH